MSFSCFVYIVVFLRISPVDVSSSSCLELRGIRLASSLLSLAILTIESSYVGLPEPCTFLTGRFLFRVLVVNISGAVDVSKFSIYAAFRMSIFLPRGFGVCCCPMFRGCSTVTTCSIASASLFITPYTVSVFSVWVSTTGVCSSVKL